MRIGVLTGGGDAPGLNAAIRAVTRAAEREGWEVLGHLQRGGSPSTFDRVLASRLGVAAVRLVKGGTFGVIVAIQGNRIVHVPLEEGLGNRPIDAELYRLSQIFT